MSELSTTVPIHAQTHSGRDEKVAFAIMTVLLVVAPFNVILYTFLSYGVMTIIAKLSRPAG